MTPKEVSFSREIVLEASIRVVRKHGWEGLTARSVARDLGASVAPVYKSFGSMEDVNRGVLEEIRRLLDERTREQFTDIPFLNIGVGIVTFARDENSLFRALFIVRHQVEDILPDFHRSILDRMKADQMLRWIPPTQLERLLDSIWLYTLGMATAIVFGQLEKTDTETILQLLKNIGNILMFAEIAGIADSESPASEREWMRLLREKKIVLPPEQAK